MAIALKVSGLNKLLTRLKNEATAGALADRQVVTAGYTAEYSLWVHEAPMTLKGQPRAKPRKGKYWDPQGRATNKFLEKAARNNLEKINALITKVMKRQDQNYVPNRIVNAMILAALMIKRESQLLTPVDLGNLKASAFVRKGLG